MVNLKTYYLILVVFLSTSSAFMHAQPDNQLIREGNKNFEQENYQDAEIYYRRALEENPNNPKALYNLANSLYRQGRFDEAINILDALSHTELEKINKSDVYHNLGNAQLGAQQIRESIDSYKNALRLDPGDNDTRYNLAYAMNLLDEMEQQQQDDPESCDGDQDQEEDQEQEQPGQDDESDPQPEQDKQQPMPDQISQEDAERILDALNQQEQKIQEEIKREEAEVPRGRPEREW